MSPPNRKTQPPPPPQPPPQPPAQGPPQAPRTRVLLVDDHPVVREGLRAGIGQAPDLEVVGEADSVSEALRVIEESRPDLAVVDLSLKDSSGLDLIKDIRVRHPRMLVLVLSMRDETFYAERALRAGARGYIVKEEGCGAVVEAIRKILKGQIYLSERLASKMIGAYVGGAAPGASRVERLTDRELEVFELIGRGLPTREIAENLHLSVKTIDAHRENLKRKLGVDSATALLKQAIEWLAQRGPG
jgi:DNA-binding NarL/FixJ family response regulator